MIWLDLSSLTKQRKVTSLYMLYTATTLGVTISLSGILFTFGKCVMAAGSKNMGYGDWKEGI